jgi:hypothetical protein
MPEERRRSFDRRRGLDSSILEELRMKYGVETTAYLTAALMAESRAWGIVNERNSRSFREILPVLVGRGLIASPTVCRELLRLVELGSDDRLLRACGEALSRRTSGETPALTP